MEFEYVHDLEPDDARARLEALGDYLKNRHGIAPTWSDNKARISGRYLVVKIDGEMALEPGLVRFQGKDPGRLWRKKASDYLKRKLDAYLDADTPLSALPRS